MSKADMKTANMRNKEAFDVRIDRKSKWGNPFVIGTDGTRGEVIAKYRQWITKGEGRHLLKDLHELKGKVQGLFAAKAKENQIRKPESVPQISAEQKLETRQELARIAGVSHDTISKVERIERDATEETKTALRSQEISINQAYWLLVQPGTLPR